LSAFVASARTNAWWVTRGLCMLVLTFASWACVSSTPASGAPERPVAYLSFECPLPDATVWIDDADASVRQFEVTEPSGVQRRVRLTSFRPNAPVDASAFKFTVPEGVRIVDR